MLQRHAERIDVGLHLCLTEDVGPHEGRPTLAKGLRELWAGLAFGRVTRSAVQEVIAAQFQLFTEKFGRSPDFLDGHLHVHQLPVVRPAMIQFLASLPSTGRPYVRNTAANTRSLIAAHLPWLKARLIGRFGAAMQRAALNAQIPTNTGFVGIYDLSKWQEFPRYLPRFAARAEKTNSIFVVHPGHSSGWRQTEYDALRAFTPAPGQINRFQRSP